MNRRSFQKFVICIGLLCAGMVVYGQDFEVDPTFTPLFSSEKLNAVEITQDGKVLVGGQFSQVNVIYGPKIIRLNPDGTTDTTFSSPLWFDRR